MKFRAFIQDRDVTPDPGSADVREVEPGVYSVLRNGKSFEARVIPAPAGDEVYTAGRRFAVTVRDPRNATGRAKASFGHARQSIAASMPGKVVRVLIEEGEEVQAGQGLVVVEAMKMQNEMKAAKPGKVVKIHVKDGATVAAGQVLVTLE